MNKKLIYCLMAFTCVLTGCDTPESSDSSDVTVPDSPSSSEVENSSDSSSSEDNKVTHNYVEIDDVSKLFDTYETDSEYDYMADYKCEVISDRQYVGGWQTTYMYDGINLLLSYESTAGIVTDYYIYDEATNQMIYYVNNGNNTYQFLDEENEYYFNYVSLIDHFELAGIEWEDDLKFDLENKVCTPKDNLAKDKIGRLIFGDNTNEYWHDIQIFWEDGYISKVEAISIYQDATYYFDITLSEHGYTSGSVKVPDNVVEFVDPNKPFLEGQETYTGNALSKAQADALTLFSDEHSMNYTVDVTWTAIYNSEVSTSSQDFHLKAVNGNYEYTYEDPNAYGLTNYTYLLSGSASSYPICFVDPDYDGVYTTVTNGMNEYEAYVGNIYLDRVLLFNINPEDFIYDETKGYITAKDQETEELYCGNLFYYTQGYGGLRVYLKETDDGSLVLDKIITSMYSTDDSGNIYSFLKTYNFSNINSTTITYPDGVGI